MLRGGEKGRVKGGKGEGLRREKRGRVKVQGEGKAVGKMGRVKWWGKGKVERFRGRINGCEWQG